MMGDEAHHLAIVLRGEEGRIVELIDGSGQVWKGTVARVDIDSRQVDLTDVELLVSASPRPVQIRLMQSLCRTEKLEWILQKSAELGVAEIHLLSAERSVLRIPAEKMESRMTRWRKILLAATKQSRRSTVPTLHAPVKVAALPPIQADLKLLMSESERDSTLKNILRESARSSAVLALGPEGGWTRLEVDAFVSGGFQPVTLGSAVLRAETAAIVSVAILQYELDLT